MTRRRFFRLSAVVAACHVRGETVKGVSLECRLQQNLREIRVLYSLRNGAGTEMGIFQTASEINAPCYIDLHGDDLLLRSIVLPVPPGLQTAGQPVPLVHRLPGGQAFHSELPLPLPVAVNDPYKLALLSAHAHTKVTATKRRLAHSVTFSVGIFPLDASFRLEPIAGRRGAYRVWPPGPAIARQITLSQTMQPAKPVDVLDFG